jgi:ribosomal protein S18 acetylase RimI-like enzyme
MARAAAELCAARALAYARGSQLRGSVSMLATLPIRPAGPADSPALVGLINSAYRGDSSKLGWTTEADLLGGQRADPELLQAIIESPEAVILVHEDEAGLAACVHLERQADACYLGMLTIRPTQQARGLGTRLLDAAEAFARTHFRSRCMVMTVIVQRTELIAWYERRGYGRTGERRPFPYGDQRFGLPKRPDLEFEVLRKPLEA